MNRVTLERDDNKQRIVAFHGRLMPTQHHGAGLAGEDWCGGCARSGTNESNFLSGGDGFGQSDIWLEGAIMRSGVMDLQMRFFGVGGEVERLRSEGWHGFSDATNLAEQIVQSPIEGLEIGFTHVTGASAFGVDCRNIVIEGSTKSAPRQEGTGPAPECVEACGHSALGGIHRISAADDVADPRMQFQSMSSTVKIDVVGCVGEELGFKQVSEPGGGRTVGSAGKCAGEIFAVDWVAPLTNGVGGFVEDGDENDGAVKVGGVPGIDPVAKKSRPFVFVTVGGAIDEQNGPGPAAPDPSIEPESRVAETVAMLSGGQSREIERHGAVVGTTHN